MTMIPVVEATLRKSVYTTTRFVGEATEIPLLGMAHGEDNIRDVRALDRPMTERDEGEEYHRLCRRYGEESVVQTYGRQREGRLSSTIESARKEFAPKGKRRVADTVLSED